MQIFVENFAKTYFLFFFQFSEKFKKLLYDTVQGPNFCTKFDGLNEFLYGKLHIILKPRDVEMCDHSIFSIIGHKYV